jgi:alcohol dehydrogenase
MRAALIAAFGEPLEVTDVADPELPENGVVLRVEATGVCRSDWHAWMGHERLPGLPHVPGHEMAGTVVAVGTRVERWSIGDRVTVPFSMGCGRCPSCAAGHLNTCDEGFTPGFSTWGSFAELVALDHADTNLIALPEGFDSVHAAALGCRFVTAFRAVADRGRVESGQWLAVHGCGGLGLSAVMVGAALGARVIAVDIQQAALDMASALGAEATIDATAVESVTGAVREVTGGGSHVSVDALGSTTTAINSVRSLRKQGRHVQVGLLHGEDAGLVLPWERVLMWELEVVGSRGIPATDYPRIFSLIEDGAVDPGRLVTKRIAIEDASDALSAMSRFDGAGMTVIDRF